MVHIKYKPHLRVLNNSNIALYQHSYKVTITIIILFFKVLLLYYYSFSAIGNQCILTILYFITQLVQYNLIMVLTVQ